MGSVWCVVSVRNDGGGAVNQQKIEPILEDPKKALGIWDMLVKIHTLRHLHEYAFRHVCWTRETGLPGPHSTGFGL